MKANGVTFGSWAHSVIYPCQEGRADQVYINKAHTVLWACTEMQLSDSKCRKEKCPGQPLEFPHFNLISNQIVGPFHFISYKQTGRVCRGHSIAFQSLFKIPFYNVILMFFIFVKHFELPCVERCCFNKLALPNTKVKFIILLMILTEGKIGRLPKGTLDRQKLQNLPGIKE